MCIRRHLKETIPSSSITCSEMGKQNVQAEKVYTITSRAKGKSKHTRQRLAVATQSFTPVGDLQATDISNLLHAYINKADI